jgi:hypothetical protein
MVAPEKKGKKRLRKRKGWAGKRTVAADGSAAVDERRLHGSPRVALTPRRFFTPTLSLFRSPWYRGEGRRASSRMGTLRRSWGFCLVLACLCLAALWSGAGGQGVGAPGDGGR